MSTYRLGHHDGRPALFNERGLVCTFEAGYQQTREQDAALVLRALEAYEKRASETERAQ